MASWWSKKQPVVARSSTEVEYRSLADTAAEIIWLQSVLEELEVTAAKPVIYCDNLSTIMLAHNLVLHSRTKHMEHNLFYVRERVMHDKLHIAHIPSNKKPADVLTKALSKTRFSWLREKLGVKGLQQLSPKLAPG